MFRKIALKYLTYLAKKKEDKTLVGLINNIKIRLEV